jgi:ABC-type Mn2+/Zn2+ transport system permease subunit
MAAASLLVEPLQSGIGRHALAEVVLIGAIAGAVGFWVVAYGLSYGAESVAHGLLPGLVLAAVVGAPLLGGALVGAVATALLIAVAARDERLGFETGTAVAVTAMVGLGALLALVPETPQRLAELLFGDPLAAGPAEIAAAAALALLGGLALMALHRPLATLVFDPIGSGALGVRAGPLRAALALLLAATVCIAAQGLGNLLALAAIVAPPLAVRRHVRSSPQAVLAGSAVGAAAGAAGIYASFGLDVAAGGAVALALCAAAALGSLLPARRREPRSAGAG